MTTSTRFDNRNPFTVPDGYFEDFAAKMTAITQPSAMPSLAWYKRTRSWIAIAAALSGVIIGARLMLPTDKTTYTVNHQTTVEESYVLAQVDETTLEDYLCNMNEGDQTSK